MLLVYFMIDKYQLSKQKKKKLRLHWSTLFFEVPSIVILIPTFCSTWTFREYAVWCMFEINSIDSINLINSIKCWHVELKINNILFIYNFNRIRDRQWIRLRWQALETKIRWKRKREKEEEKEVPEKGVGGGTLDIGEWWGSEYATGGGEKEKEEKECVAAAQRTQIEEAGGRRG